VARAPAVPEIEEIAPGLFRVPIPLEELPLGAVNCYVFYSQGEGLIVDPGLDQPLCLETLLRSLRAIGLEIPKAAFFSTHFHIDHLSLGARLASPSSRFFFNRVEAEIIPHGLEERWEKAKRQMSLNGLPREDLKALEDLHPANLMPRFFPPFTTVEDGERIRVGRFTLRVVETPGHSPGHCCLYEENHRLLLSGDHVLEEITPHVGLWDEGADPLALYLRGLDKVLSLEVALVLPGHGRPFSDLPRRVAEIKEHHRERSAHILRALADGPLTAYEIASRLPWDVDQPWPRLSPTQKYFALSETLAHLRYLESLGLVKKEVRSTGSGSRVLWLPRGKP